MRPRVSVYCPQYSQSAVVLLSQEDGVHVCFCLPHEVKVLKKGSSSSHKRVLAICPTPAADLHDNAY